jgi:hypothetical protein
MYIRRSESRSHAAKTRLCNFSKQSDNKLTGVATHMALANREIFMRRWKGKPIMDAHLFASYQCQQAVSARMKLEDTAMPARTDIVGSSTRPL